MAESDAYFNMNIGVLHLNRYSHQNSSSLRLTYWSGHFSYFWVIVSSLSS